MKARELINKQIGKHNKLLAVGFPILLAYFFAVPWLPEGYKCPVGLFLMLAFFTVVVVTRTRWTRVSCPFCKNELPWRLHHTAPLLGNESLPETYRLCPFCGGDLDSEVEIQGMAQPTDRQVFSESALSASSEKPSS